MDVPMEAEYVQYSLPFPFPFFDSAHVQINCTTPKTEYVIILLTAYPFGVRVMNLEVSSKEVSNSHLALESQAVILTCKKEATTTSI